MEIHFYLFKGLKSRMLFLWMIRMAAESAANRNVRHLNAEMRAIAAHITKQMHYINDELLPAIQSTFIEQIHASTNQEEKDRIVKMGEKEKKIMEDRLFNGYNNLLIEINNLLKIELSRDTVGIIAPMIGSLKVRLRDVDHLLKKYRDVYQPRGRLMRNKLDSRVVSPINTSKPYVANRSPKASFLRGSRNHTVSRGRIRINPIALKGKTYHKSEIKGVKHPSDPLKNEPGMVHSDQEIKQMKKNALQELIEKYTNNNNATNHKLHAAIRRFKLKMGQTHKLRNEVIANQAEFNNALARREKLKRTYSNMSRK